MIDSLLNWNMADNMAHAILNIKYLGMFLIMIVNGIIGFPSSQIMYPLVGYYASLEKLNVLIAIAVGALGNAIGNYILFLLSFKYKNYFLSTQSSESKLKINGLVHRFANRSWLWLVMGKLIPGVKTFIPVLTALLHIDKFIAFAIFLIGSTIWATILIAAGYYFGQSVQVPGYVLAIPIIAFMIISIIVEKMIIKSEVK